MDSSNPLVIWIFSYFLHHKYSYDITQIPWLFGYLVISYINTAMILNSYYLIHFM